MHWMKQGNPDVHQVDVISNERLTPDSHFQVSLENQDTVVINSQF